MHTSFSLPTLQAISLTPTVLNDPHRWLAETKVMVKLSELLLSNLISSLHNHLVESVFEKTVKRGKNAKAFLCQQL